MQHLVSIDPGVSSGIAVFKYDATTPAEIEVVSQFRGGAETLLQVIRDLKYPNMTFICEDFQARPQSGFSYTTDSLEPLVCIGALVADGIIDRHSKKQMVAPTLQYFSGGKGKAEKKKNQHRWLKENGFYVLPKELGQPDADDARSAIAHGLSWLRKRHQPTALHYFRTE